MIANIEDVRLKRRLGLENSGSVSAADLLFAPAVLAAAESNIQFLTNGHALEAEKPQDLVKFEPEKIIVSKSAQRKCYILVREPAGKVTPNVDAEGNLEVLGDVSRVLIGLENNQGENTNSIIWLAASAPENREVSKEYITRYLSTAKKSFEISFGNESRSISPRRLSPTEVAALTVDSLYFKRIEADAIVEAKKIEDKVAEIAETAAKSENMRLMGELLQTVFEVEGRKEKTIGLRRMFTLPGYEDSVYYVLKVRAKEQPITIGKDTTLYADKLELKGQVCEQVESIIAVQPGTTGLQMVSVEIPNPITSEMTAAVTDTTEYSWFKINVPRVIKSGMQLIEETIPHAAKTYSPEDRKEGVEQSKQEKMLSSFMHISRSLIGVQSLALAASGYTSPLEVWMNGEKVSQVTDTSISTQKKGFVYYFLPKKVESLKLIQPGTDVLPMLEEEIDTALVTYDTPTRKLERMVSSDGNRITLWKEPSLSGYENNVLFLIKSKKDADLKVEKNLHTLLPTLSFEESAVYSVEVVQAFESSEKPEVASKVIFQEKPSDEEAIFHTLKFE